MELFPRFGCKKLFIWIQQKTPRGREEEYISDSFLDISSLNHRIFVFGVACVGGLEHWSSQRRISKKKHIKNLSVQYHCRFAIRVSDMVQNNLKGRTAPFAMIH